MNYANIQVRIALRSTELLFNILPKMTGWNELSKVNDSIMKDELYTAVFELIE